MPPMATPPAPHSHLRLSAVIVIGVLAILAIIIKVALIEWPEAPGQSAVTPPVNQSAPDDAGAAPETDINPLEEANPFDEYENPFE